jgi:HAD superfamily hydrolase (TIGR01509 family)
MIRTTIQSAIHQFETRNNFRLDIKAVLFDMDGVLFDSMPNHTYAWVNAFKEYGLEIPVEEAYMNEGSTALATARTMFKKYRNQSIAPEKAEEIKMCKHRIMDSLPASEVMPHMPGLVKAIADQGFDRWVVTGSAQNILIDRLEKEYYGLLQRNKMVTAHDVTIGKPHPEPYLIALKKSGLNANEALVIENAPLGVLSAKAAGLFTIAINTGPLHPHVLTDAGADLLFEGSEELFLAWPEIALFLKQHSCLAI